MIIHGKRLSREERQEGLASARQWRIDNKPFFDAIYGPESKDLHDCAICAGSGKVAA